MLQNSPKRIYDFKIFPEVIPRTPTKKGREDEGGKARRKGREGRGGKEGRGNFVPLTFWSKVTPVRDVVNFRRMYTSVFSLNMSYLYSFGNS
jgi:hypothetical protein